MPFFSKRELTNTHNSALRHWLHQKISAIFIAPLTLWLVFNLPSFISLDYKSKLNWLIKYPNFLILMLFFLLATYHMRLGLTVVIEDYIHNKKIKTFLLTSVTIFSIYLPVKVIVLILLLRGEF